MRAADGGFGIDRLLRERLKMELFCKSRGETEGKPYEKWYSGAETYLDESLPVPFLRFRACEPFSWMDLAFSTRCGGVSEGDLASLNLGWDRGDDRENVCENYKRVCRALGVDYRRLVLSDQVHGKTVQYVDERYGAGEQIEKKLRGIDGLMTDISGLVLATSYADCVPLFFIDTRTHLIASSHSGWRGTVLKIGQATVDAMTARGSRPEDILVIIGPSICQDCYEVSDDVAQQLQSVYGDNCRKGILEKGRVTSDGEQKYQLDLWAANWYQLREAGIPPENIHVSGVCTCCNHKLLYSHRYTQGRRGNLNGFLFLR